MGVARVAEGNLQGMGRLWSSLGTPEDWVAPLPAKVGGT